MHTYDQLEYLPRQDLFFAAGGSIWGDGDASRETWLFDPNTNAWRQGQNIVGNLMSVWEYNMTTAYDPATDQVLMAGYVASAGYNGGTNTWTRHNNSVRRDLGTTGRPRHEAPRVPHRRPEHGQHPHACRASGVLGAKTALNATGATEIQACDAPGLEYDPVSDRFVAWCAGSDVYSLNMDTRTWTRHTATNSVSPGDPRGPERRLPRHLRPLALHAGLQRLRALHARRSQRLRLQADQRHRHRAGGPVGVDQRQPGERGQRRLDDADLVERSNASACTASGAWSGARATSGQQTLELPDRQRHLHA